LSFRTTLICSSHQGHQVRMQVRVSIYHFVVKLSVILPQLLF